MIPTASLTSAREMNAIPALATHGINVGTPLWPLKNIHNGLINDKHYIHSVFPLAFKLRLHVPTRSIFWGQTTRVLAIKSHDNIRPDC